MWSDTPGKLSSTGYSRNDSTFLKSYHSVRNVVRNIPHYSLLTRCEALRRRFVEHCSWDREYVLLRFVQLFRYLSFRQSLACLVKPATSRHPENGQRLAAKARNVSTEVAVKKSVL